MSEKPAPPREAQRTRVKFCGMTSQGDIASAVDAGADAVGIIVADSPRKVPFAALPALRNAIPPFVAAIAVVARDSAPLAAELTGLGFLVQFSGQESAGECERLVGGRPYIKAFHVAAGGAAGAASVADMSSLAAYVHAMPLFDTASRLRDGGTGRTFDWNLVAPLARERRIIVSGGLDPDNVGACVRAVRPWAVDVRSGVESGEKKDVRKMREFVRAVREADAQT